MATTIICHSIRYREWRLIKIQRMASHRTCKHVLAQFDPDTPGTDIDMGQLTALMGVLLKLLKRFKYPSM